MVVINRNASLMRLAILGASGRTGNHLVRQAIAMGHDVTAFVRRPNKLPLSHERLRVIIGDARDRYGIERAFQHADAVIDAIMPAADEPESTHADIIATVIHGMKKHGVARLVGFCDTHVQIPNKSNIITQRLGTLLLSPSANRMARASQQYVDFITHSQLDWSIVRTHTLIDESFNGQYSIDTSNRTLNAKVSRANVADFMLRIAVNGSHLKELPIISNN
jgi:putative NADH-flavin reductase